MQVLYEIRLTPTAKAMLTGIKDRRVREKIRDRIDGLARGPEKKEKPLIGELAGYRSVRGVGQRYRIIYRVHRTEVEVLVVAAGIHKEGDREDIYTLARKLLRMKLVGPTPREK